MSGDATAPAEGGAGAAPATGAPGGEVSQPAAPEGQPAGQAAGVDAPEGGGEADPKPDPAKHKIRRGGKDSEHTLEEILGMVGDDHQHTVTVNGKERGVGYEELVRMAQLGDAGYSNMQKAAKERRELEAERGRAKEDIPGFLMEHGGVEDYDTWIMQQAEEIVMLERMASEDPMKFRMMSRERDKKQSDARRGREETASKAKDRKAGEDRYWQTLAQQAPEALTRVGLTDSREIRGRIADVIKKHRAVGYDMPIADAAATVAAEHKSGILSHLGGMSPEALLDYLGDDLRGVARKAEVESLRKRETAAAKKTTEGGAAPAVASIKPATDGKKPTMLRDVRRG